MRVEVSSRWLLQHFRDTKTKLGSYDTKGHREKRSSRRDGSIAGDEECHVNIIHPIIMRPGRNIRIYTDQIPGRKAGARKSKDVISCDSCHSDVCLLDKSLTFASRTTSRWR